MTDHAHGRDRSGLTVAAGWVLLIAGSAFILSRAGLANIEMVAPFLVLLMPLLGFVVLSVFGDAIRDHGAPWNVTRLGARAEYHFMPHPARDGAEQIANADPELERFLHLWALNRGILLTPFHNMALMSPATTHTDVDRHTVVFGEALAALFANG